MVLIVKPYFKAYGFDLLNHILKSKQASNGFDLLNHILKLMVLLNHIL